ncbi:hypothetical protein, partial [Mesorhizobium sp. M7A.F.Ca.CA.002.03.2.1]|uniref:hypothetical protein n=1 Tax=Mesorhizobium sp. M7A.F.Ca.CA.002.03.2.1 TaxID=2496680 RepID=UPI0013E28FD1
MRADGRNIPSLNCYLPGVEFNRWQTESAGSGDVEAAFLSCFGHQRRRGTAEHCLSDLGVIFIDMRRHQDDALGHV